MQNNPTRLRFARILWLGATAVAIGSLLMTLPPPERRDTTGHALTNPARRRAAIWHAVSPLMVGWICPDFTKRRRGMSPRSRDSHLPFAYGNFGGAHVFRSIDNGETWRSLDDSSPTGLPDIPVHSIVVDPDDRQRLYLGTDLGVIVSIDGGQTWMSEETGFGPAVTMWLSLIRTPAGQK